EEARPGREELGAAVEAGALVFDRRSGRGRGGRACGRRRRRGCRRDGRGGGRGRRGRGRRDLGERRIVDLEVGVEVGGRRRRGPIVFGRERGAVRRGHRLGLGVVHRELLDDRDLLEVEGLRRLRGGLGDGRLRALHLGGLGGL